MRKYFYRQSERNQQRWYAITGGSRWGYCYYCGRRIQRIRTRPGQPQRHDSGTIEHLYSRTDLRRWLVTEKENTVSCCYQCNEDRNHEHQAQEREILGNYRTPRLTEILRHQYAADLAEVLGDIIISNDINKITF